MRTYTNIAALRADVTSSGSHFFDRATIKHFGTKFPETKVYGGRVFITSEQPPDGLRLYVVRVLEERRASGQPLTIHRVASYIFDSPTNLQDARKIARFVADQELPDYFSYEDGQKLNDLVQAKFPKDSKE